MCQSEGPILEVGSGIGTFARRLGRSGYACHRGGYFCRKNAESTTSDCEEIQWQDSFRAPLSRGIYGLLEQAWRLILTSKQGAHGQYRVSFMCFWPQTFLNMSLLRHCNTLQHIRNLLTTLMDVFATSVPARLWVNDPGHFSAPPTPTSGRRYSS